MSKEAIVVENLSKTYKVSEREGGFRAAIKSFFKRKFKDVHAVQNVSFRIQPGEVWDSSVRMGREKQRP